MAFIVLAVMERSGGRPIILRAARATPRTIYYSFLLLQVYMIINIVCRIIELYNYNYTQYEH